MSRRAVTFPMQRARSIWSAALLGACLSCAQVLGIPTDPELADPSHSGPPPIGEQGRAPWPAPFPDPVPNSAGSSESDERSVRSDGVLPPARIAGVDETLASGPDAPPREAVEPGDAGAPDAASEPGCDRRFERVPVDVVFIADNSGSMPEETALFEQELPSFAAQLEDDEVDYRIILLSRHRRADRSASEEASTSICIAAPVSGLAACPSERPALGPRFFQYSIKIDDGDSLERVLSAFSTPDPFDLTAIGWSEWIRPGARTIFIELTDSDSALGAIDFTTALQAAEPQVFGDDPASPRFVFHAITGVAQRSFGLDIYLAPEPIEPTVCEGAGSNPDNAGVVYQELSRSTGGLRLSVCPAAALGMRLVALATDVTLRSVRGCPDPS
jgi:hypothetical protein